MSYVLLNGLVGQYHSPIVCFNLTIKLIEELAAIQHTSGWSQRLLRQDEERNRTIYTYLSRNND